MQFHAILCNTMQCQPIPCNTSQYHAIPYIINNCWRSVPLRSGQYNGNFYYHFLSFVSSFVFYAILRFCILAGEKIKIRVNHHVVECYCAGILNGNTFLAGWTPSGQSWCWATLHLSPRMLMAVMLIKSNPIFLLFLHGFTQFKKSVGNFFSNFLIYLFWEQCSKKKWSFLMTFAIKHPPLLIGTFSHSFLYTTSFLLQCSQ